MHTNSGANGFTLKANEKILKNLINLDQIFSISLSSIEHSFADDGDGTKSWGNNEISAFN